MTVFWRALGRIILVPLGFLLASLAAVAVLFTLGMERFTHAMHRREIDADTVSAMFDLAYQTIALFSTFTTIPATRSFAATHPSPATQNGCSSVVRIVSTFPSRSRIVTI